ncbi:MAG: type II toxin-antitoxin system VapC family toxin [Dehalococcoidia bacterium]
MTYHLLDTDSLIDYLAGRPDTIALLQQLDVQGDTLCACDVVIAEVYSGLLQRDWSRGQAFLAGMTFLTTTPAMAQQAGEWRFSFARRGISLPTTDCLIAATAHGHQAIVVTGNVKDFPMQEVRLLSTRTPRSGRN